MKGFKSIFWNAQSLMSTKEVNVFDYLNSLNSNVINICETWLKERMGENIFNLDGYVTHRLDRIYLNDEGEEKRGGGLATLIKNDIRHEI